MYVHILSEKGTLQPQIMSLWSAGQGLSYVFHPHATELAAVKAVTVWKAITS